MPAKQMKPPKRHHTVPVMILENFTDEEGLLWVYDKRNPYVRRTKSEAIFFEKDFYTKTDRNGIKDTSLETFFAELEGDANQVIQKICLSARGGKLPCLLPRERQVWDRFLYYQWKRGPDFLRKAQFNQNFETAYQEALREFEAEHRKMSVAERVLSQADVFKNDIKRSARVVALRDPGKLVRRALCKLGLGVGLISKPNKSFIIGTKPVVKLGPQQDAVIGAPGVEIWLPVASDVVICMVPIGGSELLVEIDTQRVRDLNEIVFRNSMTIAGRSQALLTSLTGAGVWK